MRMRKGEQTRTLILNEAVALASQVGVGGLGIGSLAARLALSQDRPFNHSRSKEDLQLLTVKRAQTLFFDEVLSRALKHARGLPRLRALFSNWLAWVTRNDTPPGGCLMLAAYAEYDDRPGAVRDLLVAGQRELRGAVAKAIRIAIDEGHLEPHTDPWQLTFELFGIVLATHHDFRLLGDARALERAGEALDRLLEAHRAPPHRARRP